MKDKTLFADGFDEAIIGLDITGDVPRVVYSKDKMVEILANEYHNDPNLAVDDDPETMAIEFLEFNTWGAYVGKGTPIYIDELTREDIEAYCDSIETEDETEDEK